MSDPITNLLSFGTATPTAVDVRRTFSRLALQFAVLSASTSIIGASLAAAILLGRIPQHPLLLFTGAAAVLMAVWSGWKTREILKLRASVARVR